jgi:hypothetical protein
MLLLLTLVAGTLPGGGSGGIAFADDNPKSADAKATKADKNKDAAKPSAQPMDEAYTKEIRENTTEPYFSTEFVDHLPASATVPSPEKTLGYSIGTPNKLTYTKDIYRYYRELAKASPRVKVWSVGKSEEGREFLMVAVSDDANMAQIEKYKQITAKLADPRKVTEAEAQQLIKDGKPFYWASGSIHSPETGSPEMLMELAYRLAVEDSPTIQKIRKNLIVLITPVLEVDGRDRMVDTYNYRKANEGKPAPGLIYWGHYVAHDNNRDGIVMSLKLSETMMKNFLDWHPQVLHDLHESVPFLYTSTGTGPYNAWLDPIVISEWQKMAYYEIENMTARGVPGVWTHGFYDGWAPNYMFYVANGHNSIGRFYETFGNGGADTRERTVPPTSTSREWFRPNPPLPRVKWSMRNNVNMQESALILALNYTSDHAQEFLENFYFKSKRSVAKASTEGPAAWVIANDGKRPALSAQLARLLQKVGVEVNKLNQDLDVTETIPAAAPAAGGPGGGGGGGRGGRGGGGGGGRGGAAPADAAGGETPRPEAPRTTTTKIPAGSYIIRMDQPYSREADMLLDTQYYNVNDPAPYDDTGWTLGPLRNVKTIRVTDAAILKAPMTMVSGQARADGGISGAAGTKFYLVNANAEPVLATLRFRLKDVKMNAAEAAFEADGNKFNTGTFVIPTEGNPSDLRSRIETAAKDLGFRVMATDSDVKVAQHALAVPRIAVMHSWVNTQNDGWFRLGLDEMEVPYAYISDLLVRDTPNLKAKFDVIVYPPLSANVSALIWGVPKRMLDDGSDFGGPIPWKKTDLTPNLVGPDNGPDQADDIRGGLGFEGLAHLQKFVEDGGLFVPISINANLPVALGMTNGVTIATTTQLRARGSILRADVSDKASPIAYGYDDTLALYFNQQPVFRVAAGGGGGGFGGGGGGGGEGGPGATGGRPSGRGTLTDPDIPQGRPWTEAQRSPAPPEDNTNGPQWPARMQPRVVLRFSPERDLFVSGMLAGGSELAGAPAVVDVPLGRGHIVLFANNPFWRQETHGSFMLLINAALNFDHLQVGRREPPARGASAAGDDADSDNDWIN